MLVKQNQNLREFEGFPGFSLPKYLKKGPKLKTLELFFGVTFFFDGLGSHGMNITIFPPPFEGNMFLSTFLPTTELTQI